MYRAFEARIGVQILGTRILKRLIARDKLPIVLFNIEEWTRQRLKIESLYFHQLKAIFHFLKMLEAFQKEYCIFADYHS
jgi:hypothetical protein